MVQELRMVLVFTFLKDYKHTHTYIYTKNMGQRPYVAHKA